jgi:hypothetical protein
MKAIKGDNITSPESQAQIRFNEDACADKNSESGLNYFHSSGLLGPLNNAIAIPNFRPVLIINTSGMVQYVALSKNAAMAAPANGTQGIPLAPNGGSIMLATADNTYIRASSANVFGYLANDNVIDLPD